MSAAELDTKPQLLNRWSELTPINRIGRPDELRGVVTWLASDASSFCTGSEYVIFLCLCQRIHVNGLSIPSSLASSWLVVINLGKFGSITTSKLRNGIWTYF